MINPYTRKKFEEKFPERAARMIEGEITEEDYDKVCRLFTYDGKVQQANDRDIDPNTECLLGQALQRMGYSVDDLDLGSRFHMIKGACYRADIETHKIIEEWYFRDRAPVELPYRFTLTPQS